VEKKRQRQIQFSAAYLVVAILGIWLFQELIFRPLLVRWTEVPYSEFLQQLEAGSIQQVTLGGDRIFYTCRESEAGEKEALVYNAVLVEDPELVERLREAGVEFRAQAPAGGLATTLLGWVIPLLPLAAIWYLAYRRMGAGVHGADARGRPVPVGQARAGGTTGRDARWAGGRAADL